MGQRFWAGLVVALLASVGPVMAQVPVSIEITPTVSYFDLNGDPDTDLFVNESAVGYQLRLGLVFPGNWGLEGYGGVIPSHFGEELGARRSSRSYVLGGTGTFRFANKSPVTPFLAAGAEILDLDASDGDAEANQSLVYGGGLLVAAGAEIGLRFEARGHHSKVGGRSGPAGPEPTPVDESLWLDHVEYSAGLVWRPWH